MSPPPDILQNDWMYIVAVEGTVLMPTYSDHGLSEIVHFDNWFLIKDYVSAGAAP